LLEAAILTVFWGGPFGKRPDFVIDSEEDDVEMGRGIGKSTFVHQLASLVEGYVALHHRETLEALETRMLSSTEGYKHVILMDNLKYDRFSRADLESFITSPKLSARANNRGERQRPNDMTVFITRNDASFGKDMSSRSIKIVLKRFPESLDDEEECWDDKIDKFITDHKWDIIADIITRLSTPPPKVKLSGRWKPWCAGVLAYSSMYDECMEKIKERVKEMDVDDDDVREFEEWLFAFIKNCDQSNHPECDNIKIPNPVMANCINQYWGMR
jgi:hypothetical protein